MHSSQLSHTENRQFGPRNQFLPDTSPIADSRLWWWEDTVSVLCQALLNLHRKCQRYCCLGGLLCPEPQQRYRHLRTELFFLFNKCINLVFLLSASFMPYLQQMIQHTLEALSFKPCFRFWSECIQVVAPSSWHYVLESWHLKNRAFSCQCPCISLSSISLVYKWSKRIRDLSNTLISYESKRLAFTKRETCIIVGIGVTDASLIPLN